MIQVHLVPIHVQLLGAHTGVRPRDNTNCIGAATIDGTESSFTAVKHHQTNLHWTIFQCPVLLLLFAQVQSALMHDVGKGDERCSDTVVHEHFQFYERNMKSTVHDYTWQIYSLEEHNKAPLPFGPSGMSHLCRASFVQDATEFTRPDRQEYVLDVSCKRLFCRSPKIEWDSMLESQRNVALAKWHRMVGPHFVPFEACRLNDDVFALWPLFTAQGLSSVCGSCVLIHAARRAEGRYALYGGDGQWSFGSDFGRSLEQSVGRSRSRVGHGKRLPTGRRIWPQVHVWQRYHTHLRCISVQTSDASAYLQAVFQQV